MNNLPRYYRQNSNFPLAFPLIEEGDIDNGYPIITSITPDSEDEEDEWEYFPDLDPEPDPRLFYQFRKFH